MPIRHGIWTVGASPAPLREGRLGAEATLEAMILAAPAILSDQWMLVAQQEDTGASGRVDLLALAPDGTLILIELKRGRTPREVVAQALEYGAWVEGLDAAAVGRPYAGSASATASRAPTSRRISASGSARRSTRRRWTGATSW